MVSNFGQALAVGGGGICFGVALTLLILFTLSSRNGGDRNEGCLGASLVGAFLVVAFYLLIKAVSL